MILTRNCFLFLAQPPAANEQPSGGQGHMLTEQQSPSQEPIKFELPHWCCDDTNIPGLYKQVYEAASV